MFSKFLQVIHQSGDNSLFPVVYDEELLCDNKKRAELDDG